MIRHLLHGMPNLALGFIDRPAALEQVRLAKYAESKNFHSVWVTETRLVRDAVSVLGAIAATTERIRIGSAVINVWSRIAPLTALTWSTLHEMAPGRVMLGLGAWWDPLALNCGVNRHLTFTRMREYVQAVRGLLNMQTLTIQGATLQVRNLKLDLGTGVDQSPKAVPIFIGATGFQLIELAGEIADGVILDIFVSPRYNRKAREFASRGAAKGSKLPSDVEMAQLIFCCVDDDRDVALKRARSIVTLYLSLRDTRKPWIPEASGVPLSLIDEIGRTVKRYPGNEGLKKAEEIVDDEIVSLLTATGTIDDCIAKVKEYASSGCTLPILTIEGSGDYRRFIDSFSGAYS